MREIKFRAWDKKENKFIHNGLGGNYSEIDYTDWYGVHNAEISMFTGLLDKNGKEIYEGDIIKRIIKVTDHEPTEFTEVVIFEPGGGPIVELEWNNYDLALQSAIKESIKVENQDEALMMLCANLHDDPFDDGVEYFCYVWEQRSGLKESCLKKLNKTPNEIYSLECNVEYKPYGHNGEFRTKYEGITALITFEEPKKQFPFNIDVQRLRDTKTDAEFRKLLNTMINQ